MTYSKRMAILSPAKNYLDLYGESAAESSHEQVYEHLLYPATLLAQTWSTLSVLFSVDQAAVINRSKHVMVCYGKSLFLAHVPGRAFESASNSPPHDHPDTRNLTSSVHPSHSLRPQYHIYQTDRKGTGAGGHMCSHAPFIKVTHITSSHILLVRTSLMTPIKYKAGWECSLYLANLFPSQHLLWKGRVDSYPSLTPSLSPSRRNFGRIIIHPANLPKEPPCQSLLI